MPRKPAERALVPALALAGTIAAVGLGAVTRPAPAPQPQATPPASRPARPAPATQPEASAATAGATQEPPPADGGGADANADGAESGAAAPPATPPAAAPAAQAPPATNGTGAAAADDDLVYLALKEVKIEDTIPFIVDWSGKVVMLRLVQVAPTKITLVAEENRKATRREALDLLFQAFRLNGIGVVETEKLIIIDLLTEITKIQDPGLLLGPNDDVMKLSEDGLIVSKIFPVHKAKAEAIGEQLREFLPDYATMTIDTNTNQIVLQGTVGLAKRVQMFIDALDAPAFVDVKTETFRMQYADAQTIADAIQNLFEATRTGTSSANRGRTQQAVRGRNPQLPGGGTEIVNTSEQLRVVTLPQLNAITVSAEPDILSQIRNLIVGYWDIPLSAEDGNPFRVYSLKYADPIQVRDVLQAMLEGSGASSSRGRSGGASRAGQPGGGGDSAADAAVANIFRIDALADTRQLVVVSRTPANFAWLDEVINELDQPTDIGEPLLIPLKHANAVEVAEQLNALLSEAGSNATITGQQSGLTRGDVGASSVVQGGGASAAAGATGRGAAGTGGAAGGAGGEIQFPWQRGRPAEDRAPETQIIGKVRIVPIIRQNALMVVAPPAMQLAVKQFVEGLDRAGRQVLISAVIAAVDLNDDFAFGLRVSPDGIVTASGDNAIGGAIGFTGARERTGGFFDTSMLDVNVNVNAVLQALNEKTNVRIIQQPRIFTADNSEAVFFNGQEVPFITDSQVNDLGNLTQSFSYIPVGVTLNVRPRITPKQDVSLEINLTLSNTVPGQTLFGGAILDRRTTETIATVKNGQTIVLSGIRVDSETKITRKVPLLGDIPGLGPLLFTSYDNGNTTQELIAFLTPIVVETPEENDVNYNIGARERLQQISLPLEQQLKNQYEPFDPTPAWRRKPPPPVDDTTSFGWERVPPTEKPAEAPAGGSTEGGG